MAKLGTLPYSFPQPSTVPTHPLTPAQESHDKGWQKQCTVYGNKLFNRIPFEEWGLKSIPPLSTRKLTTASPDGTFNTISSPSTDRVTLHYPPSLLRTTQLPGLLTHLATSRAALHRHHLIWSIIGMPIVAPFALVPVVPNIPFFYLVYRAFSHWRALAGGKHLQHLVEHKLIDDTPSAEMDAVYQTAALAAESGKPGEGVGVDPEVLVGYGKEVWKVGEGEERLLLSMDGGRRIAEVVGVPELAVECERAVGQAEEGIRKGAHKIAQGVRLRKAGVDMKEVKTE